MRGCRRRDVVKVLIGPDAVTCLAGFGCPFTLYS